jgi:hypothetical protein
MVQAVVSDVEDRLITYAKNNALPVEIIRRVLQRHFAVRSEDEAANLDIFSKFYHPSDGPRTSAVLTPAPAAPSACAHCASE